MERSALLLAGLDDPSIDVQLLAFDCRLPSRSHGPWGRGGEALASALRRRGTERICALVEEHERLAPLAWYAPPPSELADIIETLERFRARGEERGEREQVVTPTIVYCVQAFLPEQSDRLLCRLKPRSWLDRISLATARGDALPACELTASPIPVWLPVAHPAELRDETTALLRMGVLAGSDWRKPYSAALLSDKVNPGRGLVLIDVDDLRIIDDQFGFPAGDAVLLAIADRLHTLVGDRVLRFGGDEFVIVWEEANVRGLAERIVADLGSLRVQDPSSSTQVPVSVSAGTVEDVDVGRALRRAEQALYSAKRAGKGRAVHAA